jgi:fibronectin-binding autotransporter adhesin
MGPLGLPGGPGLQLYPGDGMVWATVAGRWQAAALGSLGLVAYDGTFKIENTGDHSKTLTFSLGGMTTGKILTLSSSQTTTQTLAIPNITAADTIVTRGLSQTLSGVVTFSNATDATALGTGAVVLSSGGLSVNNQLRVGGAAAISGVLTVSGSSAVVSSAAGAASVTINGFTGFSSTIIFQINGANKSQLLANASTAFQVQDSGNSYNPFSITIGAASAAVISTATTLDASSSTVAGFTIASGLAVAKSTQLGTSLTVGTNITSTNGNWTLNNTGGNATLTINAASGNSPIVLFTIAGANYSEFYCLAATPFVFRDLIAATPWSTLVYTTGLSTAGYWTFTGMLAANAAATTGSVVHAGGVVAPVFQASTGFGVGVLPTANSPVALAANVAGQYAVTIVNNSTGSGSYAQISASSSTASGALFQWSSTFTTNGVRAANVTSLEGQGAGGLALSANNASGGITFSAGGLTQCASFSSAGLFTSSIAATNTLTVTSTGGAAAVTLNSNTGNAALNLNASTGNSGAINLQVNGAAVGQIFGNAANPFVVRDQLAGTPWNPIAYATGLISAGFITLAGTLDATNSTTAALVGSGGFAFAKSGQIGTSLTVGTNLTLTNGTLTVNNTGGGGTVIINGSSGTNGLSFEIGGVGTGLIESSVATPLTLRDSANSANFATWTAGTLATGYWSFLGTADTTSSNAAGVVMSCGLALGKSLCLALVAAPSTLALGQIWQDSGQQTLYANLGATSGSLIRTALVGCLASGTSTSVTNTVTETTIISVLRGTMTTPANFFVIGKMVRLVIRGTLNNLAAATLQLRWFYGATVIATTGVQTIVGTNTGVYFEASLYVTCVNNGSTGSFYSMGQFSYDNGSTGQVQGAPNTGTTVNCTTANAFDCKATWGAASASDVITSYTMVFESLS